MLFYQQTPAGVGVFDGTWNPSQLPGLTFWYDGLDLTKLQMSGGSLDFWLDKSGNGRTLGALTTKATYDASGLYSVGKPALVWPDGSNSVAYRFTTAPHTLQQIAIVGGYTSGASAFATSFQGLFSRDQAAVGTDYILGNNTAVDTDSFTHSNFTRLAINGGAELDLTTSPTVLPLAPSVLIARRPTTPITVDTFWLGNDRGTGGRSWSGPISEVVGVAATLSTLNQQKLEGYLAWKWGLQNSLPADHPFKQFPPS